MGRDLLYKPQTVIPTADEDTKTKPGPQQQQQKAEQAKAPVKGPRDLGQVGQSVLQKLVEAQATGKPQAHQHAYFNRDSSGVTAANFRQSKAQALRGSEEATNLRKIVIPAAVGIENPEPAVLKGALDLMGVADGFSADLGSMLGRQGAWAKGQGMTVEKIKERQARLEEMIEARKAALGRMADGKSDRPITSTTLLRAASVAGSGLDNVDDVNTAGTELIQRTQAQAQGLHARLAKMFGVKMQ
jgi:hypothetical protein